MLAQNNFNSMADTSYVEFQHGIFACFDDCGLCLITYFVPCYTFGMNAEAVGENCFLCGLGMACCLCCIVGPIVRSKIRQRQRIPGSFLADFWIWFFCGFCALIQEGLEVKNMPAVRQQRIERE